MGENRDKIGVTFDKARMMHDNIGILPEGTRVMHDNMGVVYNEGDTSHNEACVLPDGTYINLRCDVLSYNDADIIDRINLVTPTMPRKDSTIDYNDVTYLVVTEPIYYYNNTGYLIGASTKMRQVYAKRSIS